MSQLVVFDANQDEQAIDEGCVMFDYFDYHDIWHMLSAIGKFFIKLATILEAENMATRAEKSETCILVLLSTEIYTPDIY